MVLRGNYAFQIICNYQWRLMEACMKSSAETLAMEMVNEWEKKTFQEFQ